MYVLSVPNYKLLLSAEITNNNNDFIIKSGNGAHM